jgi:hypothetical protein
MISGNGFNSWLGETCGISSAFWWASFYNVFVRADGAMDGDEQFLKFEKRWVDLISFYGMGRGERILRRLRYLVS